MIITAGALIDGSGGEPIHDAAVLVEDGLITFAGHHAELRADRIPAERLDFPDGTIIPGLIDAHVHTTSPAS